MIVTNDIVGAICGAFKDAGVPLDLCRRIEDEARHAYGGEKIHINRYRPGYSKERIRQAMEKFDPGRPVKTQARELGLDRKTMYRWLREQPEGVGDSATG